MALYPVDWSEQAKRYRSRYEVPVPDFDVDVKLIDEDEIDRRANVQVRIHVGDPIDEYGGVRWGTKVPRAKKGEPLFVIWVTPENPSADVEDWDPFWISLSKLLKDGWADASAPDDYRLFLDQQTREQMLIWWDEHGGEIEDRVSSQPSDAEIERHLTRAGIKFSKERSGGADWSVPAWSLGDDIYLTADDDREFFALLHRDMDGDDEIEDILSDTLLGVIDRAPEFLKGGRPTRHSWPTRR